MAWYSSSWNKGRWLKPISSQFIILYPLIYLMVFWFFRGHINVTFRKNGLKRTFIRIFCFTHWLLDLTLSWRNPISCRNQPIDSQNKSMDWFPYNRVLRHERFKDNFFSVANCKQLDYLMKKLKRHCGCISEISGQECQKTFKIENFSLFSSTLALSTRINLARLH